MKKGVIIVLTAFICITFSNAQRWKLKRYEAIAGIGVANIFGDIGGTADEDNLYGIKDFKIRDSRPNLYLGLRYRLTEDQAVKLSIVNAIGTSKDLDSKNENRNYQFSTFLFEPSLQYEYYILNEDRNTKSSALFSHRGMVNAFSMISLYAFTGIGGVLYVPKVTYDSIFIPDKERFESKAGFSPVIPLGIGIKYVISADISLNFEFGGRLTFSDYIDGFNSDFSDANDVYYFGTFSVIYKLQTSRRGVPILFQGTKKRKSGTKPSSGRKPVGM